MVFDRLLSSIDGGDVLDVGCGAGQFTEILVKSLKSFTSVTGVDVDANSMEEARKKHPGPAFRFLQVSAGTLPLDEESFSLVAISKALHHVQDPELMLMEMKRVLRKGGYFLINEMHRDQLTDAQQSHVLYHHLRSEVDKLLGISHNHTFRRSDLIRLADGLGLRDRVMVEFSPDPGSAKDPSRIEEFNRKMDGWLTILEGHPAKMKIAARVDTLKERFHQVGICRPPQLVILGKK
jgi:SAM-dependent methyltransferase